jgi:hypothetical protein
VDQSPTPIPAVWNLGSLCTRAPEVGPKPKLKSRGPLGSAPLTESQELPSFRPFNMNTMDGWPRARRSDRLRRRPLHEPRRIEISYNPCILILIQNGRVPRPSAHCQGTHLVEEYGGIGKQFRSNRCLMNESGHRGIFLKRAHPDRRLCQAVQRLAASGVDRFAVTKN